MYAMDILGIASFQPFLDAPVQIRTDFWKRRINVRGFAACGYEPPLEVARALLLRGQPDDRRALLKR